MHVYLIQWPGRFAVSNAADLGLKCDDEILWTSKWSSKTFIFGLVVY